MNTSHLWFLEASIVTRFEVSEIAENTLLKLLHVPDGAAKRLEPEDERSDNIRASDMVKTAPKDTGDVFLVWQEKAIERRVGRTRVTHWN